MASDIDSQIETDALDALQTTAERVERFRMMHEDAVRDLREQIAEARGQGYGHDEIDQAIRRARDSVRRFTRLSDADLR
jgi:uncharacterized protein (UPF0335 family)